MTFAVALPQMRKSVKGKLRELVSELKDCSTMVCSSGLTTTTSTEYLVAPSRTSHEKLTPVPSVGQAKVVGGSVKQGPGLPAMAKEPNIRTTAAIKVIKKALFISLSLFLLLNNELPGSNGPSFLGPGYESATDPILPRKFEHKTNIPHLLSLNRSSVVVFHLHCRLFLTSRKLNFGTILSSSSQSL